MGLSLISPALSSLPANAWTKEKTNKLLECQTSDDHEDLDDHDDDRDDDCDDHDDHDNGGLKRNKLTERVTTGQPKTHKNRCNTSTLILFAMFGLAWFLMYR